MDGWGLSIWGLINQNAKIQNIGKPGVQQINNLT